MEGQRFHLEEKPPSRLNRFRRHPRVRISAPFACLLSPLKLWGWLRRPPENPGVVYDLSLRGARVSTAAPIEPGDEVALTLRLPRQIRATEISVAKVRWKNNHFFGLAFTKLSQSSYSRLKKYVSIAAAHSCE
jgi:hypothetical protein